MCREAEYLGWILLGSKQIFVWKFGGFPVNYALEEGVNSCGHFVAFTMIW